jgi:hypothetical protein
LAERGKVTNVRIYFQNGQSFGVSNCSLQEDLTKLTIHTAPGEYSVVPLANVLFYDAEEDCE